MIETLTIITLCLLYLIYFRPGTTPQLQNPLVIERVGVYRMTLAPQLNLAQPFIETIAKRIGVAEHAAVDETTCSYVVRDKRVVPKGFDCYVLAITRKNGMLYFEAMTPPAANPSVADGGDEPCHAWLNIVQEVAAAQGINVSLSKEMRAQ